MTRHQSVMKAADTVLEAAEKAGIIDHAFVSAFCLKIGKAEGVKGGISHKCPTIWMSTHDRYHDVVTYTKDAGQYSRKSNWKRAYQLTTSTGVAYSPEYARIDTDPEIGGVHSNDSFLYLLTVTCHEMAHSIVYWRMQEDGIHRPKPHGDLWQDIYRQLRNLVVNHLLKPVAKGKVIPFTREEVFPETPKKPVIHNRPKDGTKTSCVWIIADRLFSETGIINRKAVIQACIDNGLNPGMASTQFSRWNKVYG